MGWSVSGPVVVSVARSSTTAHQHTSTVLSPPCGAGGPSGPPRPWAGRCRAQSSSAWHAAAQQHTMTQITQQPTAAQADTAHQQHSSTVRTTRHCSSSTAARSTAAPQHPCTTAARSSIQCTTAARSRHQCISYSSTRSHSCSRIWHMFTKTTLAIILAVGRLNGAFWMVSCSHGTNMRRDG